jgi:hypothetical protein
MPTVLWILPSLRDDVRQSGDILTIIVTSLHDGFAVCEHARPMLYAALYMQGDLHELHSCTCITAGEVATSL